MTYKEIEAVEPMEIYARVQKLLDARNDTGNHMCNVIGLPRNSSWNLRLYIPGSKPLYCIAHYLGVSMEYLISGETPEGLPAPDDTPNMFVLNDQEKELLESFKKLDSNQRKVVLGMISNLSK